MGVSRRTGSVRRAGHLGLSGPTHRGCELKIGYARASTDEQDLTAQRNALAALGVYAGPGLRRPGRPPRPHHRTQ